MKQFLTSSLVFILLLSAGCSSSKDASSSSDANSMLVGSWALEGGSSNAVQFTSGGDVMFEQGDVMTGINRLQNTNRSSYMSRLVNTATYEYNGSDRLTLNVMADWSGKGTGTRRAADKSVASTIVFSVVEEGDMLKLTKVSMSQSGSGTDNTNDDESLSFTLKKM